MEGKTDKKQHRQPNNNKSKKKNNGNSILYNNNNNKDGASETNMGWWRRSQGESRRLAVAVMALGSICMAFWTFSNRAPRALWNLPLQFVVPFILLGSVHWVSLQLYLRNGESI